MSSQSESTKPISLEGVRAAERPVPWQASLLEPWSFGSIGSRVFAASAPEPDVDDIRRAANREPQSTAAMRPAGVRDANPVVLPETHLGKRGFVALQQWEGVVEAVTETGFRARLVPYSGAEPDRTRTEFTDFDLDDLADESDKALVVEGAVFYWTIGRYKNAAGTVSNMSLVRFRRIPPPTSYRRRLAGIEAEQLLEDLRGDS